MEKIIDPKAKPMGVKIKSINVSSGIAQNPVTQQVEQSLQIFGLGDDDKIYMYDSTKKVWILM